MPLDPNGDGPVHEDPLRPTLPPPGDPGMLGASFARRISAAAQRGRTVVPTETGSSVDNASVHYVLPLGVERGYDTEFRGPPRPSA